MTTETQKQAPTHRIYAVKGEGKQARWIEIGAAWPNQDGKGFSLKFDAVPVEGLAGRIVIREPKAEKGGQQ